MADAKLLAGGLLSLMVSLLVVGAVGLRAGNFRPDQATGLRPDRPQSRLVFRRPWAGRLFMGGLALLFLGVPPLIAIGPPPAPPGALAFLTAWVLAVDGVLLWFAGPDDLSLDLDRRTYTLVRGWPLLSRVRSGPLDDLRGVYVGRGSGSPAVYLVGVRVWAGGDCLSIPLGRFSGEAAAERFAGEVTSALGLGRVKPPRQSR